LLRQIAGSDSRLTHIRNALAWIRTNYTQPIRVEELAALSGMSVSVFHRHFKAVTAMTPIQYQKHFRLYEARRRLFSSPGNAAGVAFSVGYESASQFSREYARLFGTPPGRDVRRLRSDLSRDLSDVV
jgi:transcriptional regulator GlxA family with amidase domain